MNTKALLQTPGGIPCAGMTVRKAENKFLTECPNRKKYQINNPCFERIQGGYHESE
jgi:hypothetical protein